MNIPELFLFENHHNYDLKLSRPAYKGLEMIKPRGQFLAEKDFFEFVKVGMIRFIGPYKQKEVIVENKLILDQPPIVTNEGKVEHVAAGQNSKKKILKEGEQEHLDEVLLVESPCSNIKIIKD